MIKAQKDANTRLPLKSVIRQPNQVVVLLSLGDVKHDVLSYLKAHPNIQI